MIMKSAAPPQGHTGLSAVSGALVPEPADKGTVGGWREGRRPQQARSFDRTRTDNAFMSSRRCVVIGAGILGAAVAARLAAAGLRVTLLDQDEPGRATSRWSFAWINSNDKAPRPYHDLN